MDDQFWPEAVTFVDINLIERDGYYEFHRLGASAPSRLAKLLGCCVAWGFVLVYICLSEFYMDGFCNFVLDG